MKNVNQFSATKTLSQQKNKKEKPKKQNNI